MHDSESSSSTDESSSSTDEPPSPTSDEPPSPMDEPPSPVLKSRIPRKTVDESPSSLDEPPSPLLKSRIPRKTVVDRTGESHWGMEDAHCPLRKGIICYYMDGTIFEHNIHSSGKHEPRIIVPKNPSRVLLKMSFVPIKGNRLLLFAKYREWRTNSEYLHLAIHETRSDHRVGPALWSFDGSVDGHFNILDLELKKSTGNALGVTFWAQFDDHWKLFDISTETDTSNSFPLIESGRINVDLELKFTFSGWNPVALSPDTRILLNVDLHFKRDNETIDIHYLDPGGTNFSFVTRITSIPSMRVEPNTASPPRFGFSADGSKFAISTAGGVSVWDTQSRNSVQTLKWPEKSAGPLQLLQFSSGISGKELLLAINVTAPDFTIIHVIDMMFATEERLVLKTRGHRFGSLFFDPGERTLYAAYGGTLYEWDLRKNKPGPKWWIGEE